MSLPVHTRSADATAGALADLRIVTDEMGYAQLYGSVAGGALLPADHAEALRCAHGYGGQAGAALRLLALGDTVPLGTLGGHLARLVERLGEAGLAVLENTGARLDDLILVPVIGGLLLTGVPPTYPAYKRMKGRAYLGEDSLRLARALPSTRGSHVLDLGSGCGIQGILASRDAAEVVCTDLEQRSLELTALNAKLNGRAGGVEILAGDAFAPVAGRRFDLIVTLPPYLPELPGAPDAVVAAGRDGLGLLRRLVAAAGDHLRPGGELVSLAQLLCDDDGPLLVRELAVLAPSLAPRLVAFDRHPIEPFIVELAASSAPDDPATAAAAFQATFRALGATGICTAFLRLIAP